jgi:alpha-L-rhamnosidase
MQRLIESAKRITAGASCDAPILRRVFRIADTAEARIAITAHGFFEARLNGRRISEDRFVPAVSLYHHRSHPRKPLGYPITDHFTHRSYYLVYDLTPLMRDGENVLEIALGTGWYKQYERISEGDMCFGDCLSALYAIAVTHADGSRTEILSDGSEVYRESEIVYNQLFIGETHDARRIDAEPVWKPVSCVPNPDAILTRQDAPADRVARRLIPRLLSEQDGKRVYDLGENISGILRVRVTGDAGTAVTVRYAENLDDSGMLDFTSTGGNTRMSTGKQQVMTDTVLCDGKERVFEPRFVWHAFRYAEIEGAGEAIDALVIHSDTPVIGRFESDHEGLCYLYRAFLRTQLDNMHGSIPSDCPHRERLGYTGDGQLAAEATMLTLGTKEFYRKWIRDIFDSQDAKTGHVNHTAPFMGGGGGPGGWGCAAVIVPYRFYRHYGDDSVLREYYPRMQRWIAYLDSRCEDGLITHEEPKGWCLGDWCTLEKVAIPEAYVNTYYFVKSLSYLCEIARVLGQESDISGYRQRMEESKRALETVYFDPTNGDFAQNVQGANAFAIDLGLGDGRTRDNLIRKYEELGAFDTGIFGTDILLQVLFDIGASETAYRLLASRDVGSFLYMKDHGATTIWEYWTGQKSNNHPMFGASVRQIFTSVLGIRQDADGAGFRSVTISPAVTRSMTYAKGSTETEYGRISVEWRRADGFVTYRIGIDGDMHATLLVNGTRTALKRGENVVACEI